MKTILATLAILGLAASPTLAMCGHDQTAQSKASVEVAQNMSTSEEIDMEATASIPAKDTAEEAEAVTE